MTSTKSWLRRLLVRSSIRRWSLMFLLVSCVILLQSAILLKLSDSRFEEGGRRPSQDRSVSESATRHNNGLSTHYNNSSSPLSSGIMFQTESCSCGLHFTVDRRRSLILGPSSSADTKYLAIGIPTVQRQKDNYIVKTVTSLLDNMADTQRREVVIIIMVADLDPARRNVSLQQLESSFRDSIRAGQVHVIAAPLHFYTDFKVTKQTYDQPLPYVEWRAKQNFDYAYLMRYSSPLSLYYMQLEDDVIAAKDYVTSIRQYIDEQSDSWTCLEFSELGFIGKLYRSKDLERLSQMLLMFFQEQPVDYTYLYFNMLMTQLQKRLRTPTLFQHQGLQSSFPGKIQPLKDRFFDNVVKQYKGDNPAAEIYTTMKTYLNFLPRLAYSQAEGYFWTHGAPTKGDSFMVVFDEPQQLERVVVETGSEGHPTDILISATLTASLSLVKSPARFDCTNDIALGTFNEGRIDIKDISSLIKFKVMCLQIQVVQEQEAWAIIREIAVFLAKGS